jgi:hypothetical protein
MWTPTRNIYLLAHISVRGKRCPPRSTCAHLMSTYGPPYRLPKGVHSAPTISFSPLNDPESHFIYPFNSICLEPGPHLSEAYRVVAYVLMTCAVCQLISSEPCRPVTRQHYVCSRICGHIWKRKRGMEAKGSSRDEVWEGGGGRVRRWKCGAHVSRTPPLRWCGADAERPTVELGREWLTCKQSVILF